MDVNEAFNRLLTAQVEELDRVAVEAVLRDVRMVHGFVESVRLRAVARLESIAAETGNADPAASAAAAARTSRRHAERSRKRAAAAAAAPPVGDELANGGISPEHLDALGSALARLEPAERAAFIGDGQEIAALARATTADEFSRALDARIQARFPGDPLRRFAQQRRDTTFRWWRDPVTGMVRVFGEFDPERGLALVQRLARTVEGLFHDATPEDCPSDPERKQGHLRALALLRLVLGSDGLADSRNANGTPPGPSNGTMEPSFGPAPTATSRSPRRANSSHPAPGPHQPTVDMIVVIDLETLRGGVRADSRVDLPLDADLPIETLRRLACTAGIVPAVLDGDGVVLDVGRRQRLATADQRRALRTMYRTCGLDPGCRVPFNRCEPHHIDY